MRNLLLLHHQRHVRRSNVARPVAYSSTFFVCLPVDIDDLTFRFIKVDDLLEVHRHIDIEPCVAR